jgi:DNA-binding NarL/FixJ family response regulator
MTQNQIKLFIVDDDPIFRLGLVNALTSVPGFRVIAQADTIANTWRQLAQGLIPDILILELAVGRFTKKKLSALQFCQQLEQQYPNLVIFILTSVIEPQQLLTAKALGVKGYCPKGTSQETVVFALRRLASGGTYWQEESLPRLNLWQNVLSRMGNSGRQQIQNSIEQINNQLAANNLSVVDQLFWSGRKRELLVARWLVNRILPTHYDLNSKSIYLHQALPTAQNHQPLPPPKLKLVKINSDSLAAQILKEISAKISLGLVNRTGITLEIDILKTHEKQELLYTVLNQLIKSLEELSQKENLVEEIEQTLWLIWQEATINFFFQYFDRNIEITEQEFSEILTKEFINVRENIFRQIYLALELFEYLLRENPLVIDNIIYQANSPEAMTRAESLIENLLIQLANGVMQVILNNFYDLEIFKYNLYSSSYRSSREIARFRNELSWQYRLEKYFNNPKNIFESRYRLLTLQQHTIQTRFIYSSRVAELDRLTGLPWLTTITLETRDAIAPRLRSILAAVGSGVVYLLTQVVGRGIGLIGKGIIQGIGSTVQEPRYSKKDDRPF